MAYMSQDRKKQIAANLKPILKGTGLKYSLGVRHHSTLVLNIWSGPVDFIGNYRETMRNRADFGCRRNVDGQEVKSLDVNPYWYKEHFSGSVLALLEQVFPILNEGNYDKSDIQSDYFCCGWYVDVNIGKWNKPYQITK